MLLRIIILVKLILAIVADELAHVRQYKSSLRRDMKPSLVELKYLSFSQRS